MDYKKLYADGRLSIDTRFNVAEINSHGSLYYGQYEEMDENRIAKGLGVSIVGKEFYNSKAFQGLHPKFP